MVVREKLTRAGLSRIADSPPRKRGLRWKLRCHPLLLVLLILVASSTATQPPSAADQFWRLQKKLRQSRLSNDWHANLAAANELKKLLNGAPTSLIEDARANTRVGNFKAALLNLKQFTRMGQSSDLLETSLDFAPLHKTTEFAFLLKRAKANRREISVGSTVFPLSDPALLAEDVDYGRNTKRFFITSIRKKKVISLDANGLSNDFAAAPDHWPMLAIKADAEHSVVWTTEVALRGFSFVPQSVWGRSAGI